MRIIYFLLFIFLFINSNAQKIEKFYDWQWKETTINAARFYTVIEKKDTAWHRRDYFIHEKTLQMDGYYLDSSCKIKNGLFYYFHPNKTLSSAGLYVNGKKQGVWRSYYSDGRMKDSTTYENGYIKDIRMEWYANGFPMDSLKYNSDGSAVQVSWFNDGTPGSSGKYQNGKKNGVWQYFHKNGKLSSLESFSNDAMINKEYFDEKGNSMKDTANNDCAASFPGGSKAWQKYISKNIFFPDEYQIVNADEAVVVISATIDEDGNVTNTEVYTPFYPAFDAIALKAVKKSPKWMPARNHNRNVQYQFIQPVNFSQRFIDGE